MRLVLCALTTILLYTGGASAQDPRLESLLDEATRNNPRLKSRFSAYQAALERVPQVGALPDPQVALGLYIRPMHRFMGSQRAEISVSQMFPWFGTLDAAKHEAAARARAAFERFREAASEVHYEVKATYFALHLLEAEIEITRQHVQILDQFERLATIRFSGGADGNPEGAMRDGMRPEKGGLVDVLRVQMEANELNNRLALLEDGRKPLVARLNALLSRPIDAAVVLSDSLAQAELPVAIADIPDSIRANNPVLAALEVEEEVFAAEAMKHHKMRFPTVGLGVRYGLFQPRDGSTVANNGRDMLMPTVTFNIPIWQDHQAAVREADHRKADVLERQKDEDNHLQASHADVMRDLRDAERRAELYGRQSDLADQAQRILTVQYSAGGGEFEDVLRMQRKALDYRLGEINAMVDRNIAVAMLARLMGR